jgi:hypothetical protein
MKRRGNMIKVYLKLKKEQLQRGVIFSSTLSERRTDDIEGLITHEVLDPILVAKEMTAEAMKPESEWLAYLPLAEQENSKKIERLLNDSFFSGSIKKYNIIRK